MGSGPHFAERLICWKREPDPFNFIRIDGGIARA
jgi:hypothetical protein